MKQIYTINKLELVISNDLINEISQYAIDKYPNEFGGFLIGKYSNDYKTVEISSTVLPINYKGTPVSFLRLTEGLNDILNDIYRSSEEYYVGEWHSHPNGSVMYSGTDMNAINEIVECDTVYIKNPILLIISIDRSRNYKYTFYYYKNKKLIPYGKD